MYILSLTLVPSPNVTTSLSRQTDLLAGSSLNITCVITLDSTVNTPVTVTPTWTVGTDPISTDDTRVIMSDLISSGVNQYQSILSFTTLSATQDNGTYQCNVTVTSASNYIYVTASDSVSDSTSLSVTSK